MIFNVRYILFIILTFFAVSCSNSHSFKKDDSSLIFYCKSSNEKQKEILLNNEGQIIRINTFKDGKISTEWLPNYEDLSTKLTYYGNGQVKEKGYFKNGKKHSLWSYFDRDGHLLIQRYFSYGKPSSIWIWYDHEGSHLIDHHQIYEDIRDDGILTRYYRSGNVKEQKQYSNNKLNGNYVLFHDNINNTVQLKGKYVLDAKIGTWETFNDKGVFSGFFN